MKAAERALPFLIIRRALTEIELDLQTAGEFNAHAVEGHLQEIEAQIDIIRLRNAEAPSLEKSNG